MGNSRGSRTLHTRDLIQPHTLTHTTDQLLRPARDNNRMLHWWRGRLAPPEPQRHTDQRPQPRPDQKRTAETATTTRQQSPPTPRTAALQPQARQHYTLAAYCTTTPNTNTRHSWDRLRQHTPHDTTAHGARPGPQTHPTLNTRNRPHPPTAAGRCQWAAAPPSRSQRAPGRGGLGGLSGSGLASPAGAPPQSR